MKLKEIYNKDIDRSINPAVVVSDKKKDTIKAEIQEYVFTDELIEKLFLILDTIINKKSGKTGVWINGYYGSGKSHFIKYVHYLINAGEFSNLAFEMFEKAVESYDSMKSGNNENITLSTVKLLHKKIIASKSDNIMFNVEDETDDGSQERLTRIFLYMLNKFRGYNANDIPLAILLEKQLDKKGVFTKFKELIASKLHFDWDKDAANVVAFQLNDVLDIAKEVYPALDKVALHNKLANPESYKIGIKTTLIPEINEFLEGKEENYRLLFLVDEISQYIGSSKEILLNFQNIIERVSNDCNNQVWIACTAQQSLDDVSIGVEGVQNIEDEFGKILGRFDTRISLQSNDAAFITQKRVLDKNSVGIKAVSDIYNTNKDYIENQFKISHELYKGYKTEDDFVMAYPFVPYQFKLIADVFEAFQQLQFVIKEVKDNERSVLGITHFTAKQHGNDLVGGFMPFDAFYNQQFYTNLTNRGAKAIQNAFELNYVKQNAFAKRVVKVLFMISNLLENKRQTFPSTIDNLAVLLIDKLDQNKAKLIKDIKAVLEKLTEESIIREEKGSYFFFNEDEMDVQNLIKNQTVGFDDRWATFDDIFRPITKLTPKVKFGQSDFSINYLLEGKEIFRRGDFKLIVLLTDQTPINQKVLEAGHKDLIICINEWFLEDKSLRKSFEWYCKTNKYFSTNTGSDGSRAQTNDKFRLRNKQLEQKIQEALSIKFADTRFISQQNIIEPDRITGAQPHERLKNLIELHLSNVYKNNALSNEYAQNQSELKKSVASTQTLLATLSPAEIIVNDFITVNNNQVTVQDLIKHFEKEPFGWKFEAVLDILVHLVKKKKREFKYKGEPRQDVVSFINKAVSVNERSSCEVITGEEIDQAVLDQTVAAYKNIFNENINAATDGGELFKKLESLLKSKLDSVKKLEDQYYGKIPFAKVFKEAASLTQTWLNNRDPKKLFNTIMESEDTAKELFDLEKGILDFIHRNLSEYNTIKTFIDVNQENIKELAIDELEKAHKIKDFLKLEDPRREFRHIRKAYEELKTALNKYTKDLKEKVIVVYKDVFEKLEKEATKYQVESISYANEDAEIYGIQDLNSIGSLKNKQLGVGNFKATQLAKIIAAAPKSANGKKQKTATLHLAKGTSTIATAEELDTFLAKLKTEMLQLINNNNTIILK